MSLTTVPKYVRELVYRVTGYTVHLASASEFDADRR